MAILIFSVLLNYFTKFKVDIALFNMTKVMREEEPASYKYEESKGTAQKN